MLKNRDIFIYSFSDWSEEMVSNRYHMVKKLTRYNRVFFFERPIIPALYDRNRWREYFRPIEKVAENFYLVKIPYVRDKNYRNQVYAYYVQQIINSFGIKDPIFWFYNYQLAGLIEIFKPVLSVYHCTEDYSGIAQLSLSKHQTTVLEEEKELLVKADLVFAVSRGIAAKHSKINPLTFLTSNAVDYELYKQTQEQKTNLFGSKPVLGYAGNLSAKVDYEILAYLAQKLPNCLIALIGPVSTQNPYLKSLKKSPNVKFIGKQPVENLPALIREFDVCLIPYIQEEWFVRASQPLKLFECLAAGKPIVSTPMDCLRGLDKLVLVGKNPQEFLKQVKIALKEKQSSATRQKRIQLAQKNTWDNRFRLIDQKMTDFLSGKLVKPVMIPENSLAYFQKLKRNWLIQIDNFVTPSFQQKEKILAQGGKILKHEFTVLNKLRKFSQTIDWSAAFDSEKSWVKGKFEELNQITYANGFKNPYYIGDVKLVWEFNKHLHFIRLAQCYALTHDEKYAQEFIAEMTSWLEQNPYEFNHAWTQTLIVSHRAISWTIALGVFIQSPSLTEEIWQKIFSSLEDHANYIDKYYEIGERSSNHLLGNAAAQIVLCSLFPEITHSSEYLERAQSILEDELKKQIYPDGASYEQSLSYHRVILEFLLLLELLKLKKILKIPAQISQTIKKMAEFLLYATQPNGFYQPISDADGARVFLLDNDVLDARPYLNLVAILFNNKEFENKDADQSDESGFYINPRQLQKFNNLKPRNPKIVSKLFPDSGYAFLRKDWSRTSSWLFFDCGPVGMGTNDPNLELGTHGHSDTLNFGLSLDGQTIITDIGSYVYTTEQPFHQYFRSAKGHNVAIIDDTDQNVLVDYPWTLKQTAQGKNLKSKFDSDMDYVSGEHTGYQRLEDPVQIKREIFFSKKDNFCLIKDSFKAKGKHKINSLLHLFPWLKAEIISQNLVEVKFGQKILKIAILSPVKIKIDEGKTSPVSGWYATDFGKKSPAQVINLSSDIKANSEIKILLSWGKSVNLKEIEKF